tara:strand:- start:368 stop:613 length:246 start_codon:yes stop_codon:yes gene_type:complete
MDSLEKRIITDYKDITQYMGYRFRDKRVWFVPKVVDDLIEKENTITIYPKLPMYIQQQLNIIKYLVSGRYINKPHKWVTPI